VLVLIPRIEDYAPAIEAVFATAPEKQRMAFSITDLGAQQQSELLRGFIQLLHIGESRLEAEQVFALLEQTGIARRFELLPDDFVLLRQWVRESGIRWGRDENARLALNLPPTREHSWRHGFDRLLLGYALPGEGMRMFNDVLPYDDIEGGEAQLLGRLQVFVDALAALESALLQPRSLAQWKSLLERVLTQFYTLDENEQRDAQILRAAAASLLSNATRAAFDTAVPLEVWRGELEDLLESAPRTNAFLNGGISFAALRPMRPVPARFVALLGLNDGEFPRPQSNASFDLLAQHPLPGDRVARDEDRYALLEAMLAARERLYLSHTGRSVRDNSVLPPSPLLSEVLDALKRGLGVAADELLPQLLIEHPLQAFSQRYFDGSDARLYSYVEDYAAASRAAQAQRNPAPAFFSAVPAAEASVDKISLDRLQRFWRNPSQSFIRETLGLRLEVEEELLEEAEPFAPDALALSSLRREILAQLVAGSSVDQSRALARAAWRLPHGASGDVLHAQLFEQLKPLQQAILSAGPLAHQSFEIECGGELIGGSIDGLGASENLQWRAGPLHAKARLKFWLAHLFGCVAGIQRPTRILGLHKVRDKTLVKTLVLQPVADAAAQSQSLCALMRAGQTAPLPFFPDSSFAYAEATIKDGGDPSFAARRAWESSDQKRGECEDVHFALAFRGADDPLDQAFEELALAVYTPLLEVCRDD
jgi:exodeoxyribonuclease V gamma subunit